MKWKTILPVLSFLAAGTAQATIRTVCNVPSGVAQYNTIQAAVDASSSGDSILVQGSSVVYTAFTITNKQLVVIGPGWAPIRGIAVPLKATVDAFTISGSSSSGTEIQGFIINNAVNINSSKPDNLRFIRNWIKYIFSINPTSVTISGYLFEGNIVQGNTSGDCIVGNSTCVYQNFLFQNNIFFNDGPGGPGKSIGLFSSCSNVVFDHNLWYGPGSGAKECFFNCSGLTITNNIFVRRDAANGNSGSLFSNCITFNAGNNTPWSSNGNSDGGGNVSNQDPLMVDQTSVNNGVNNPLLDFTIASGPANNSGSDSKDMGLLYDAIGSLNWTISRNSRLPFIYSMIVTTPNVAAGGNVQVTVEARRNN